jgi:hypothetical protein
MQGVHAFEPKSKVSIDLESFVAEDHFLRRIDRVLDLSFIRELTAARYADGQGRPSIAPCLHYHPTKRAHQPTAKIKTHSHFFNRPDRFRHEPKVSQRQCRVRRRRAILAFVWSDS